MKIFVKQYPAMLRRALFQAGIEDDQSPRYGGGGISGVAGRVPQIPAVLDSNLAAVEKPGEMGWVIEEDTNLQ